MKGSDDRVVRDGSVGPEKHYVLSERRTLANRNCHAERDDPEEPGEGPFVEHNGPAAADKALEPR